MLLPCPAGVAKPFITEQKEKLNLKQTNDVIGECRNILLSSYVALRILQD